MSRIYVFLGKHTPEVLALIVSVSALVVGVWSAWCRDPISLNRGGTVIAIVGVLLACTGYCQELIRGGVIGTGTMHSSFV